MFDSIKMHVKDMFLRGHTGDECPQGALPPFTEGTCVRSSFEEIPQNCCECRYGAAGHVDPKSGVVCGHPNCPKGAGFIMSMGMAHVGRQPWCPIVTGRMDNGVST